MSQTLMLPDRLKVLSGFGILGVNWAVALSDITPKERHGTSGIVKPVVVAENCAWIHGINGKGT